MEAVVSSTSSPVFQEEEAPPVVPFFFRPAGRPEDVALPPVRVECYCTQDKSKEVTLTLTRVFLSYIVKAIVGDTVFFLFLSFLFFIVLTGSSRFSPVEPKLRPVPCQCRHF